MSVTTYPDCDCCNGGSGSGSGVQLIQTNCCGNPIPSVLRGTVVVGGTTVATFFITYQTTGSQAGKWFGSFGYNGYVFTFLMGCSFNTWGAVGDAQPNGPNTALCQFTMASSCSPLNLIFSGCGYCGATGCKLTGGTIYVTE